MVGSNDQGGPVHGVQGERWVLGGSWAKDQQAVQEAQEAVQGQQEEQRVTGVEVGDDVGTPWRWVR